MRQYQIREAKASAPARSASVFPIRIQLFTRRKCKARAEGQGHDSMAVSVLYRPWAQIMSHSRGWKDCIAVMGNDCQKFCFLGKKRGPEVGEMVIS